MKQILYFSAAWCGPCKMFKPTINEAASSMNIRSVDVDQEQSLAQQYNIRSVPTLVLLENGQEKSRISGVKSLTEIRNLYNS